MGVITSIVRGGELNEVWLGGVPMVKKVKLDVN
jgi:hypothetical protein